MDKEGVFSVVAGVACRDEREIDKLVAVKAVMNVLGVPMISTKDKFKEGHRQCLDFLRRNVSDDDHDAKEKRRRLLLWATEGRAERGQHESWSDLTRAVEEMAILT
ncbi:MAG TPA: hypothetical protein VGL02_32915 [Streptomyces sp.]